MKLMLACVFLISFSDCNKKNISCKKEFFVCADACASICSRTIRKEYEFGKCFSKCNEPCRAEYCREMKEDE